MALRTSRGHDEDLQNSRVSKLARRVLPPTGDHRGDRFFLQENGKRYATPLLAVLVVETSGVLFAIDPVPAGLGRHLQHLRRSSDAFAVLGLRALFFALEGPIDRFVCPHYGLAAIPTSVGVKLLPQRFGVHVPIAVSLLVIFAGIAGSLPSTAAGPAGRVKAQTRERLSC